jgi:hypothetical protein
MKYTAIGDIHGRPVWKKIVDDNPDSHYVFIGDYLDPYESEGITELDAIANFEELLDFKKSNPDNVTMLIGNHDAQYLYYPQFGTNNRSHFHLMKIIDMFKINRHLFEFAFQVEDYLFIHAGISNEWFNEYKKTFERFNLKDDFSNLAIVLNEIGKFGDYLSIYDKVSAYRWGSDLNGSPIWADKRELVDDYLLGIHQIVGHNKIQDFVYYNNISSSITFCDCIFNEAKGLTIEIN